jgi:hypothetical protein
MKYFLILIYIIFSPTIYGKDKNISLTFNEDTAKYWQYISDKTMGGVSEGNAFLDYEGDIVAARLVGSVSTDNNGGFIQLRSTLSFLKLNKKNKKIKGVRLNVKGNGETYHIFIRTSTDRSYRDYFSTTFPTNDKWTTVDLPFEDFTHRYSNKVLDGNDIRTFGIVAYGREFLSDVSVSRIVFYY